MALGLQAVGHMAEEFAALLLAGVALVLLVSGLVLVGHAAEQLVRMLRGDQ